MWRKNKEDDVRRRKMHAEGEKREYKKGDGKRRSAVKEGKAG